MEDHYPVFGTENITSSVSKETVPETNLRFIFGADGVVDQYALAEQIGASDVIVYCSDWGSGQPNETGMAKILEQDVRHFQDAESYVEGLELNESIHPVLKTLMVDMQGLGRDFYVAGDFDGDEEINTLDLEREASYREYLGAIANFEPIADIVDRLEKYTTIAANYNCAAERRAFEQIDEIIQAHAGSQIAVIASSSFPLLPRYFGGGSMQPPLTLTKYHMPWTELVRGAVRAEIQLEEFMIQGKNEYLDKPEEWEPAHRLPKDQIIFAKQLGFEPSEDLYFGAIYSEISTRLVGYGTDYGVGVDYRLADRMSQAKPMLYWFEGAYWDRLRLYFAQSDNEKEQNPVFGEFCDDWLKMSL